MEFNQTKQRFILKKYNKKLIEFDLTKLSIDNHSIEIISMTDEKDELPPNVYDERSLLSWIRKRGIPRNRAFVDEIIKAFNTDINDLIRIIKISKSLSVNDVYWIVEDDFNGLFEDHNLYENPFSNTLGYLAYTGVGYNGDSTLSPEWTTGGNLAKCWRRKDNKLLLYKAGTGKDILVNRTGYEPYSEFYVSRLMDYLNIKHVNYELEMFKNKLASVCECFCNINYSFVPIGDILNEMNYNELKNLIYDNGFQDDFSDMILIDALTYNCDRHYYNFGFIKDNRTNEYVELAPIYDNGLSLFSNLSDLTITDTFIFEKEKDKYELSKWNILHKDLLADNMNRNTISNLININKYRLEKHPLYNLSDARLKVLNLTLQRRADELLEYISSYEKDETDIEHVLNEANKAIRDANIVLETNDDDINDLDINNSKNV